MIQQQNTITSGGEISILQQTSLAFCIEGPLKGSPNAAFLILAPANDMCHRSLAISDSGLTRGLSLLQTVTFRTRRDSAGKSDAPSADFLHEIRSADLTEKFLWNNIIQKY
jgi:hypothetical protein